MEDTTVDPRIEIAKAHRERVKKLEKDLEKLYKKIEEESNRLREIEREYGYHPGPSLYYEELEVEIEQITAEINYYNDEANTLEYEIVYDQLDEQQRRERGFIE